MTPWKCMYFQNVLAKFKRRAFLCRRTIYFEEFSPEFKVPLFAIFSNESYQCLCRYLFKFMISCKEVMHNEKLLLQLFPFSLDGLLLDRYMDLPQ